MPGHEWAWWSGEIRGYESDMPGTAGDPCVFANCAYERYGTGDYQGASFHQPPDKIGTSDLTEWMLSFVDGSNGFEIWDVDYMTRNR